MKIAMIGHKRIPSREGGIEVVVEKLATSMVERGHNVYVYNRKGHHVSGKIYDVAKKHSDINCKNYKGIKIITVPTVNSSFLNAFIYSLFSTVHTIFGNYDVVHFHAEGICALLWIPHLFGIRTVATIHGLDWKRSKWGGFATKYIKFGEKIAAKYADEIIVLSKNNQKYFQDTYGRKTHFIPNGIDKPTVEKKYKIIKKLGLEENNYILFVARIVPEKGLHYLLDAFKEINTSKYLVIAGGSSHTDSYMNEIRKKAKSDRRVILAGFLLEKDLAELYNNAYLFILPSDIEGMSISLLEAMSYGNCCLVSDIPENLEIIGNNAMSFSKSNVDDLYKKLDILLKNPNLVEHYKTISSSYICQKYNWDNVSSLTMKLYYKKIEVEKNCYQNNVL